MRIKEILLVLIITIPAFLSLLNTGYFSMHDDQHVARLSLLVKGIEQGYLYPCWVDGLGFGYGYPLFNFYPPLIYYVGFLFHLIGFSLIWSVKLTFVTGFILASLGVYLLVKRYLGKMSAYVGAALYTFFFYHSVTSYVRGALAEFFSMAILPFVFLSLDALAEKPTFKRSLLFASIFALLILNHPLIAFPSVFFIAFAFIFYFLTKGKDRWEFLKKGIIGGILGLGLSAFFWLPSLIEKQYTLINSILTQELANYKLHFICLQQFIYSPWGYGGSASGCLDGMTFQLGKIHISLLIMAILFSVAYLLRNRLDNVLKYFYFYLFLLIFSLFMSVNFSSFIWDRVSFLWYLQFPWRFLTFTSLFIAVTGSYVIYFLKELLPRNLSKMISLTITIVIIVATIMVYSKYFKPQRSLQVSDAMLTSQKEISWRVSGTSYEFVPSGVKTKKTNLNTTTLAIDEKDIPQSPYKVISGKAEVSVVKNLFSDKQFHVKSQTPVILRINTYNFPGWQAYLVKNDEKQLLKINDDNNLKLITLLLPKGDYIVQTVFTDTLIRRIANLVSLTSLLVIVAFWRLRQVKSVS